MRTCTNCGKGIAENTRFCPFCGAPCSEGASSGQPYQDDQQSTRRADGVYDQPNTAASSGADGLSIAGLVLGIVAIVFAFIPSVYFISWILGVIGIIISAVAISKSKGAGRKNGFAVAGLVTSIVALALGFIVFIIACGVASCAASSMYWR